MRSPTYLAILCMCVCGFSQLVLVEPMRTTPASLFADRRKHDGSMAENISDVRDDMPKTTPGADMSQLGLGGTGTLLHYRNAPLTELIRRTVLLGQLNKSPATGGGGDVITLTKEEKTALANQVAQCEGDASVAMRYYCINLLDGLYHDPWNPWCGFIKCTGGVSLRKCCRQGTWMGLPDLRHAGRKSMCRQRLPVDVDEDRCPQATDFDLCRNAKDVDTEAAHPQVKPTKTDTSEHDVPDARRRSQVLT